MVADEGLREEGRVWKREGNSLAAGTGWDGMG